MSNIAPASGGPSAVSASDLEHLRDRIRDALDITLRVLEAARVSPRDTPLVGVRPDLHEALHKAVIEAQAIWFDTNARRYIDREEPVHLDRLPSDRVVGRVSGSSYHDIALAVVSTLCRTLRAGTSAGAWLDYLRHAIAAGDATAARLAQLPAEVACETAAGIAKLRAAAAGREPGGCEARHEEGTGTVRGGAPTKKQGKGKAIDARMLKMLSDNLEAHDWDSKRWAERLGCTAGMVRSTKTWKEHLPKLRAMTANEREATKAGGKGRRRPTEC